MCTAAELNGKIAYFADAHTLAVLFTKQSHCAFFLGRGYIGFIPVDLDTG